MRTTLDLPDDTFRRLKAEAALRGLKLKELVRQLVESGLAAGPPVTTAQRPRSPLPVVRPATGITHPSLSNFRIEEILSWEGPGPHAGA